MFKTDIVNKKDFLFLSFGKGNPFYLEFFSNDI